jgi:hypothetical protein
MTVAQPEVDARWPRRALILACALAATLPLAIRGDSCGHDFDFHLQSWLAVAQSWHSGAPYPHWIEGANYAAGEPRLVFYPPVSWMLGGMLGGMLGALLSWSAAPVAFTLIVLAACGFAMEKLARAWLPASAATVAACAYILNPYALFVSYERTAYAELTAGIWLPLIVLYALRDPTSPVGQIEGCHPERGKLTSVILPLSAAKDLRFQRSPASATIPLALAIAAVWLTNAPAAVMACYSLAAISLWKSVSQKSWRPILRSTVGLALGIGLAGFYLVPAAYERRWVDIARAIGPGMRVEDSFLFGHTGQAFHDQVLRAASWIFVTMLAAIAIGVGIAHRRKTARRLIPPALAAAAALLLLQLRWSDPLWKIAPELQFLQFPWRWSLALSIVFALAIGAAASSRARTLRAYAIAILVAAVASASFASQLFWQPCDDEDAVAAQVALFRFGTGFEGTDEYTPLHADNSIVQQRLPQVRVLKSADAETARDPTDDADGNPAYAPSPEDQIAAQIQIEQWLPEQKAVTIAAAKPGYAVLRLMDYPAWRVLSNGGPVFDRPRRDDGLMTIPIQPGRTRIEIVYAATPDRWWGRALSAVSMLGLLALAFAGKKTAPSRIS